jgi:hypothetical protein
MTGREVQRIKNHFERIEEMFGGAVKNECVLVCDKCLFSYRKKCVFGIIREFNAICKMEENIKTWPKRIK